MSSLISFQQAVKDYGSKIIGPVDLEVQKGDVLGFLGPNGSGKTTCIRMLLGLMSASSGRVLVNGLDPISQHVEALRDVAYSPELPNIQTFLTPKELLTLILHELLFPSSRRDEEIRRVLELVGLLQYSDTKVGKLSKGMVQRLSIAQALIGTPKLLVLDEPMIGLDPAGSSHFRELFRKFSREEGGTVFMSSHIMSEIESTCTTVAMIHSGKILFHGATNDVIRKALEYSVIMLESSPLSSETLSEINRTPGVARLEVKQGNDGNSLIEIMTNLESADLRPVISELVIKSGARLFTIKRADNLLERAYIEALRKSDGARP